MSRCESDSDGLAVAQRVREACLAAARRGFEEAAVSGLCCEGAWEAALGAVQMLDLNALLEAMPAPDQGGGSGGTTAT